MTALEEFFFLVAALLSFLFSKNGLMTVEKIDLKI